MNRQHAPITTLAGLCAAMDCAYNSAKTSAELHKTGADEFIVRMYFDSGKGHSGAFWSEQALVSGTVAQQAVDKFYVRPQYDRDSGFCTHWVLTNSSHLLAEVRGLADEWRKEDWERRRAEYEASKAAQREPQ